MIKYRSDYFKFNITGKRYKKASSLCYISHYFFLQAIRKYFFDDCIFVNCSTVGFGSLVKHKNIQ